MSATGFHEGELATQRRAGVEADAKRLESMLDPGPLSAGATKFLAAQTFAAITARDREGALWTSPLSAGAGFLRGEDRLLRIAAVPRAGDPLYRLPVGQQIGLIAVDFDARRRMRINGTLVDGDDAGLRVHIDQAYGNCPRYIHRRDPMLAAAPSTAARRGAQLEPADAAMIAASDTFFLGTTHPLRGGDASHRGGPAGFVRVSGPHRLWWPDYPGNNMFNSFGNLAVDDEAALLFVDFATGATLQISGTAEVQWSARAASGDDGGVGRHVTFSVDSVVSRRG
ncbi:pyridoxamine 5'-phosphate oxidase family protein [Mycobacterium conspicuum]|nr:pyridoxamine 5'-phosphate oxidase family protein [Mycobacterium conspicuum]ORV45851.1 pyridoxamine 5'-phosphate oxidase [Mycobacterium conspicuum]